MKIVHILLIFLVAVVSSCKPDGALSGANSKFVFTKDGIAAPTGSNNSAAPAVVAVGPSLMVVSANPLSGVTSAADVLVGNINSGDMVALYTDSRCTVRVGGAISSSTSVLITTSNLIIGDYLFYAKSLDAYGVSSKCSSIPATYSYTGPDPVLATSMTLKTPTTTPNHVSAPTITLGGVQPGDIVHLYTNSTCTADIASALATTTTLDIQTNALSPGDYIFYTKSYNAYGISSACSSSVSRSLAYTYNYFLDVTLTYDFVPNTTGKWDYTSTTQKPLRNVYVEMKKASDGSVITSFNTSSLGKFNYYLNRNESVYFDIYAEIKSPSITVLDNTNAKAQYVSRTPTYNISGDFTLAKNLTSGWSGTNATGSYTSARVAAPFAILDSLYSATLKVSTARPSVVFPALKTNWSVNNVGVAGSKTLGKITNTHYDLADRELYVLGKVDANADEYDRHLIVREWAHSFVANFSRDDSIGGVHALGDTKDQSSAFSEGFATAFSAMVFDPDIVYIDAAGTRQQTTAISFNLETGTDINPGWFSEASVAKILYDLYDVNNFGEAFDTVNTGIGPIYDVLTGTAFKTTPAITSIFSFIVALKADPALSLYTTGIDTILVSDGAIGTGTATVVADEYGTGEIHQGSYPSNLPLFKQLTLDGSAVNLTLWGSHTMNFGDINSALNNRYIRFTATATTLAQLSVTSPDSFSIQVFNKGALAKQQPEPTPIGAPQPALVDAAWTYVQSSATPLSVTLPNITTVIGEEYIIRISIDKSILHTPAVNNLNISLSGIGL